MSDQQVYLRITRRKGKSITFEWIGPEDGIVTVTHELLAQRPDVLAVLPWKMLVSPHSRDRSGRRSRTDVFTLKIVDDAGEGEFQAVVMPEGGGSDVPVCLYVRFPERPGVGTRFTYNSRIWELYEERLAQEGAIEAGNSFWAAKPVAQ